MRSEGELHVQAMRLVCEALEDREENGLEVDWDVINQQLDHMDVILQGITDQRNDDAEQIQILKKERHAAEAEVSRLRKELSADAVRQELEELRAKNFALLEKLATVENAAATENETLREKLTAAEAAVSLQRSGIERLNKVVVAVRSQRIYFQGSPNWRTVDEALDELDAGTEPAPATEAAPCPECERWQRAQRINSELFASKAKEIERLNAFVDKVRRILPSDDFMSNKLLGIEAALNTLDPVTSEPEGGK